MEVKWIKVLNTEDGIKAELAKSVLQSHQIESVVVNKQDSAYVVLGFSEVLVPEEQAEQALEILKTQDLV